MKLLSKVDINKYMGLINHWNLNGNMIEKEFILPNFVEALSFMLKCGIEAEKLRKLLNSDKNASHIAEFAIGTNPNSRMKGNMAEDKVLKGCVHIAVGDNHTIGGHLKSKIHLDGVILNPMVELDGSLIVDKGLLLPLD